MRQTFQARLLSPSYKPHRLVRGAVDVRHNPLKKNRGLADPLPFRIKAVFYKITAVQYLYLAYR
jgi:hypothetical protein